MAIMNISPRDASYDDPLIGSPEDIAWKDFTNQLADNQQKLRHLPEFAHARGILFPDDSFVRYWQSLIAGLLVYTATISIFRISFIDDEELWWLICDTWVDSMFFIDVLVNCFLAYYDSEMTLVVQRKTIFLHYLRTWMVIDVVSCLPFQYIVGSDKNYSNVVRVARLPRLYKLVKVTKLMRVLKMFKDRTRHHSNSRGLIQLSIGLERLIWMLTSFLLLIHLVACFWVLVGKFDETTDNWIFKFGYVDAGLFDMYVVAFYWSITTLATVGYGDIVAVNSDEMILCSIAMLLGIFVYSYVISSITSLIANFDIRKSKLAKKMGLLNEIARQFKFSKLFYKKVSKAIEYESSRSIGVELAYLINDLPAKMRSELLYVIHRKMIENSSFFEGKPLFFVAEVSELLRPQKTEMNEIIYKEAEFAREMYLIYKGEVSFVLTPEMVPYLVISQNYYFGETDILITNKERHTATAVSNVSCELFTLNKDKLKALLDKYPEVKIEVLTLAKERLLRNAQQKLKAREDFLRSFEVSRMTSNPMSFNSKNRFVNMLVKKQMLARPDDDSEHQSSLQEEGSMARGGVADEMSIRKTQSFTELNLHRLVKRVTSKSNTPRPKKPYSKLKEKVRRLEESIAKIQLAQSLIYDRLDSVLVNSRYVK
jgi:hypothetical protein